MKKRDIANRLDKIDHNLEEHMRRTSAAETRVGLLEKEQAVQREIVTLKIEGLAENVKKISDKHTPAAFAVYVSIGAGIATVLKLFLIK